MEDKSHNFSDLRKIQQWNIAENMFQCQICSKVTLVSILAYWSTHSFRAALARPVDDYCRQK
jgi:hypothetical protein